MNFKFPILLFALCIFFYGQGYAQVNKSLCSYTQGSKTTKVSSTTAPDNCDTITLKTYYYPYIDNEIKYYCLQFVIRTDSLGNPIGGINKGDIDYLMAQLNNYYNPQKFSFCSYAVEYNTALLDEEVPPNEKMYVFVDDYPTLGRSGNPIHMDYTVVMDSSSVGYLVLAHEIGHNFQLLHVSDPGNLMNSSCCGTSLDSLQIATMHCWASNKFYEDGLLIYTPMLYAFGLEVCNNQWEPYSKFFTNTNGGCIPLTINFKDSTLFNPASWLWDFGDGNISTDRSPTHTYTVAGNYTVTLVTVNSYGSDTLIKKKYISAIDTVFNLPFYENFEDTIFPPPYCYLIDPDQIFTWGRDTLARGNGNSLASAMISGYGGFFYFNVHDMIFLPPVSFKYAINPYITFSISYPSNFAEDTLDLFAGIGCSSVYNLLYSKWGYKQQTLGTYDTSERKFIPQENIHWRTDTVSLNAYTGIDNVTFQFKFRRSYYLGGYLHLDDIRITADSIGAPPVADFTSGATGIIAGDTVFFTDLSTYADKWQWLLPGSLSASDTVQHPFAVYNSVGTYDVTLMVSNMFTSDTITKTQYITVSPLLPQAGFTSDTTTVEVNDTIHFTDLSANASQWFWSFAGGTPGISTEQNPSVIYDTAGSFPVTLIVSNFYGADTLTKLDYITVMPSDTTGAGNDPSLSPLKIYPNPFNESIIISFNSQNFTYLSIDVYNCLGIKVFTLANFNIEKSKGKYYEYDTRNLKMGIYYCILQTADNRYAYKMIKTR